MADDEPEKLDWRAGPMEYLRQLKQQIDVHKAQLDQLRAELDATHSLEKDLEDAIAERDQLRAALESVLADIADYERVNNLAPNPGKKYCWQSVEIARRALDQHTKQP
jgi:hypothetical protein